MELYVRALAADPDHAPAAERLAEIYATRGRWADVEELLDVVIDGLEPGETDRLVALEMKLAEACIQLGKTDKNKMDKALDSLARAHEARAESLPVLHKYGDLRMQRREWKDALNMYEAILRDQRQTLSPAETAEIAMQIGACHVELGNQDRALAAYLEAKTFDPTLPPGAGCAGGGVRRQGGLGRVGGGAPPARRHRRARGEGGPGGGDRRRVRRQAVGRRTRRGLLPRGAGAGARAALDAAQAARRVHEVAALAAGDRSAQSAREGRGGSGGPRAHAVHGGADPARRAEPARRGGVAAGALPRRGPRPDRRLRGSRDAAQGEERLEGARAQLRADDQAPAHRGAAPRSASACGRGWATSRSSGCTIASWRWPRSRRRRRWSPATSPGRRRWPTSTSCREPKRASRRSRRTSGCSRAIRIEPIRTARSRSCTATATSWTSSGASPRRSIT